MSEQNATPAANPTPAAAPADQPKSAAVVTPPPAQPAAPAKTATDAVKTESKADGGQKTLLDEAGEKGEKDQADKKPGDGTVAPTVVVPEKYEFKAPDGMTIDDKTVEAFTPVLKEAGLSQAQVDKLIPTYAQAVQNVVKTETEKAMKEFETAQEKNYNDTMEAMKQESIKALGSKWQEELGYAAKTRDRFFSAKTVEILNRSGASNNIHFLNDLIKLGRSLSEDKLVEGQSRVVGDDTADKLYPTMAKK